MCLNEPCYTTFHILYVLLCMYMLRLLYSLIIYEIVNFSFFALYSLLLLSFFLYLKSVPIYVIVHVYFSDDNSSTGTEDQSSSTGQSSETGEGVTAQHGGGHGGQLLSLVPLSNC